MRLEENMLLGEKIAISLMYDGGRFCGWQVQKNSRSVQEALQDALEKVLGFRPDVSGCSRTDSGVHANDYVCHILSDGVNIPADKLPMALNFHLRDSGIAIKSAKLMPPEFHARYSSLGKEYVYKIWNAQYRNPFYEGRAMFYPQYIDIEGLRFTEREFAGRHDFRAFMTKGSKNEDNTVRTVEYFKVEREGSLISIYTKADGFLYNMVRIMVGTYLDLARRNETEGSLKKIIQSCDRKNAGDTAAAEGLYLNKVFY